MEIAFGDFHDSFSPGEAISRDPQDGGAGRSIDIRRRKTTGPAIVYLCHCDEPTGDVAIRSLSVPQRGTGGALHRRGRGLPRPCGPRNDVVNLAGPSDLGGWLLMRGRAILESPLRKITE